MTSSPSQEPQKDDKLKNDTNDFSFKNEHFPLHVGTKDLVAYILLILGIVLLFFQPIYGGLLIGIVGGVYFSNEIIEVLKRLTTLIEEQGITRSLILGGLVLAFFICAPAIFVGAALVVCLRWFVFNEG